MNAILKKLTNLEMLEPEEIRLVCLMSTEILMYEPNVPYIASPVTIVGDIHGQYYDLANMFKLFGTPNDKKYVFLGDYVDRGRQSIEVYLILLVYKIIYPQKIFLVRGNHETKSIARSSFRDECKARYKSDKIYEIISATFCYLLIGCLIDGRIMCVHGGISPDCTTIIEMQMIDRFNKKVDKRFVDIMWSDPGNVDEFTPNTRGAGYLFGEEQAKRFCMINNINYIVRAHQICFKGFLFHNKSKNVISVWSAPNYMYSYGNKASVLNLNGQMEITEKNFDTFEDVHMKYNQTKCEKPSKMPKK
ncbi:putative serine/threonine protein phosphatase [Binucleata daphniae]